LQDSDGINDVPFDSFAREVQALGAMTRKVSVQYLEAICDAMNSEGFREQAGATTGKPSFAKNPFTKLARS
jgi:hypothetical protein